MHRNKAFITLLLVLFALSFVGCMTHNHVIGNGSQTGQKVEKRTWYALWGLVPISPVDAGKLAGGATDYNLKTEQGPLDILINIFTSMATIYSRTVTVTK